MTEIFEYDGSDSLVDIRARAVAEYTLLNLYKPEKKKKCLEYHKVGNLPKEGLN